MGLNKAVVLCTWSRLVQEVFYVSCDQCQTEASAIFKLQCNIGSHQALQHLWDRLGGDQVEGVVCRHT